MLIYSIISLIMSNAVNTRRDSSILYSRISILILLNSCLILYNSFFNNFLTSGLVLYNGLICIENYTLIFTLFILFLSILIIAINSVFPFKQFFADNIFSYISSNFKILFSEHTKQHKILANSMSEQYRIIEYPLIILFCIVGAVFLISSFDIISVFLSIELQSYALYLICSLYRNSESSVSASLTYFLLGGLSSCIILLGISLLYINSGSTSLENIYIINNVSDIFYYTLMYSSISDYTQTNLGTDSIETINNLITNFSSIYTQYFYLQISLIIMSVGFLFKISAAPFHFWSPDVYDAVPTIVTTFIAIIPKISVIVFLHRLVYYTSSDIISLPWINNIIISSILSMIIGSILGLTQYRIKRLYAYSTISHLGFLLLGLSINNVESTRAMFFYLTQYSISNLNAFIILITIAYTLRNYINNIDINIKDNSYSPIQLISQLKGYYSINPLLAISLSITLFSFAGIPPLIGFFAKQMILTAAINNGFILTTIVAILTSVISAVYYLIIIKMMFFEKSNYISNNITKFNKQYNTITSYYSFIVSLLTLLIMLFIFFDQEIFRFVTII